MKKLTIILFLIFLINANAFSQVSEIHCKHFFFGYPTGTPASNDMIIRDIYALSSNDNTKFADWVCYRLDKETVGAKNKAPGRKWKADTWLDDNETLEPNDYKEAPEKLNIDRGHQAPLASFKGWGTCYETNYLSNITPQDAELNRGLWKQLEEKERKLTDTFDVIYVMTGPLYEKNMEKLPKADEPHKVPSGYWKIICVPVSESQFEHAAFIFNQSVDKNDKLINHLVTIDEIEKRSGLDFLWILDDKIENKVEKDINKKWVIKLF